MKKYIIEPEVAGQLGNKTVLNYSTQPPTIEKLNYEFDDWLGDDFLEGFQCFICTQRLAEEIQLMKLTGFNLDNCEVTRSQEFEDLNDNEVILPIFYWIKIFGDENDDFFITSNGTLVVSDRALKTIKKFNLNYCDVKDYD